MSVLASTGLQIQSLSCERGLRRLFGGVDMILSAGDALLVEGENGAGKTTLLKCLAGLSSAYTGTIEWRGQNLRSAGYAVGDVVFAGHTAGLKVMLSPRENLRWWAALHLPKSTGYTDSELDTALQQTGLSESVMQSCFRLSSGQQRRAALARLYLSRHRLWVLDEPFTSLDRRGVVALESRIAQHRAAGGMLVMTSHQPSSVPFSQCLQLEEYAESGRYSHG